MPSPWTLLRRVAGNEVSQPAQGSIFNCHLFSVTTTTASGMGGAVPHAFMHKHTVHKHICRQTVLHAYKQHILAYNRSHSELGVTEISFMKASPVCKACGRRNIVSITFPRHEYVRVFVSSSVRMLKHPGAAPSIPGYF